MNLGLGLGRVPRTGKVDAACDIRLEPCGIGQKAVMDKLFVSGHSMPTDSVKINKVKIKIVFLILHLLNLKRFLIRLVGIQI